MDPYAVIDKDAVYSFLVSIGIPADVSSKLRAANVNGSRLVQAMPSDLSKMGIVEKDHRSMVLLKRQDILEWFKSYKPGSQPNNNNNSNNNNNFNPNGGPGNMPSMENSYTVGKEDEVFISQISPILSKSLIELKDLIQKQLPFYQNPQQQKARIEKTLKSLTAVRDVAYDEFLQEQKKIHFKKKRKLNGCQRKFNQCIDRLLDILYQGTKFNYKTFICWII